MTFVTAEQLKSSPHGCDCQFVQIGNAGIKIYNRKNERNDQFQLQVKFHKIGLAPACWFMFDFKGPQEYMLYGYYSEVADEVRRGFRDPDKNRWENLACEMKNTLSKKGIEWLDNHGGNIGILNGKPVLIDFGCVSGI